MKKLTQRPETLFVLGYMLLPILGLVSVAMGVWSVVIGHKWLGIILIVILTQAFVWGAVWCIGARRRLLESAEADIDASMSDQEAIDAFNAREALEIEAREKAAAEAKAAQDRAAKDEERAAQDEARATEDEDRA